MASTEEVAAQLAEWTKTLDAIQQKVSQTDDMVRSMGVDPDRLRALLTPEQKEEARRRVAEEWDEAQRELERDKVAMGLAPSKPKLRRNKLGKMI